MCVIVQIRTDIGAINIEKNAISIVIKGVNGASAPPNVPKAFVWQHHNPQRVAQVLAMWHGGGYGGINISDCVIVQGLQDILCVDVRGVSAVTCSYCFFWQKFNVTFDRVRNYKP